MCINTTKNSSLLKCSQCLSAPLAKMLMLGFFFFVEFFMSNLASANTFKVLALALLLA